MSDLTQFSLKQRMVGLKWRREMETRGFKKMSRVDQLIDMEKRLVEGVNETRVLCQDAHRAGDAETEWYCKATLAEFDRTAAKLKIAREEFEAQKPETKEQK